MFPSYDGNGMFLSMGNIAGDGRIGLLFMDFDRPHRIRAHAHATVSSRRPHDGGLPRRRPHRPRHRHRTFVNCPRYIAPHAPGTSKYVPDVNGDAPLPGWKKIDALQPFLPHAFKASPKPKTI